MRATLVKTSKFANPWRKRGFTLVELVAITLVVSFLVLLGLPTLVRAQLRTKQATCQTNLRQIGFALQAYSEANDGKLPGPLSLLASPKYGQNSTNELIWYIAPYLGFPPAANGTRFAQELVCPSRESARETERGKSLRNDYALADGRGLAGPPFGREGTPMQPSLNLLAIAATVSPADCSAMADADKGNVNPTLKGWGTLPYKPVHGKLRNQLYFDWHVGSKAW